MKAYRPLGEILISKGRITRQQLQAGLTARQSQKQRLGSILISMGYVDDLDIAQCLAEQYDMEVVDVAKLTPEPEALSILDADNAVNSRILPYRIDHDVIECAIADPIDVSTMDMISRITDKRVMFRIAPVSALIQAIHRAYSPEPNDNPKTRRAKSASQRTREERGVLLALIDSELNGDETASILVQC